MHCSQQVWTRPRVGTRPQGSVQWAGRSRHLCFQLLNSNVVNDLTLLESLLDNLVARQKDPCASVRRLVLRGLANIASGSPDKVRSAVWALQLGTGAGGQRAAPWGRACRARAS